MDARRAGITSTAYAAFANGRKILISELGKVAVVLMRVSASWQMLEPARA